MKAMRVTDVSAHPPVAESEIPRPQAGPGEVLVRVRAAGVTPTELLWYPTTHQQDGAPRTGAVPCHEFSGEVVASSGAGTALAPGSPVYGMNDWFADGALAEYCITRPEWIAPKPRNLDHAAAASVPIAALTAWQGLYDRARLRSGEHVLIHGGAGSVGLYAIQLAHRCGARISTTVSARDAEFVRELGAERVIDYKAAPFDGELRDVDVVFDTVGGATLERSWSVLKPGGRLVTIAASSEPAQDERTKAAFFIVKAERSQLAGIGRLLESGDLRTFVAAQIPFERAVAAWAATLPGGGRGKRVVLLPGG